MTLALQDLSALIDRQGNYFAAGSRPLPAFA
jgi:hypothetical protein